MARKTPHEELQPCFPFFCVISLFLVCRKMLTKGCIQPFAPATRHAKENDVTPLSQ